MKILIVHNRYQQSGGEDVVFRDEGDLLKLHGHEVRLILYDNRSILSYLGKLLSGLRAVFSFKSAAEIEFAIKEFNPDVVHVHNFFPLISPSIFFVTDKLQVPVVITLHNYRLICPTATLFYKGKIYERSIRSIMPWHAIWKGAYRDSILQTAIAVLTVAVHKVIGTWKNKVSLYIVLTEFAKNRFLESSLKVPACKFYVKPNFVVDRGLGLAVREDYFLYVGRLTEEKGIATMLNAAELGNFRLVVIGTGPLQEWVVARAKENQNITCLGSQGREVVMRYLKSCRALLFPSIWFEGFPLTMLEAFSTGTPVIASKLGSMEEIISDEENGMLFTPGNAYDLAARMIQLEIHPDLAKLLSTNARKCYLDYYTPDTNYQQLIQIYQKVTLAQMERTRVQEALGEPAGST